MQLISVCEAIAWIDSFNNINKTNHKIRDQSCICYRDNRLVFVFYWKDNPTIITDIKMFGRIDKFNWNNLIKFARDNGIKSFSWFSENKPRYDFLIKRFGAVRNGQRYEVNDESIANSIRRLEESERRDKERKAVDTSTT